MRNQLIVLSALLCIYCNSYTQTNDSDGVTYGIWQNCGGIVSQFKYPELKGRIFNYKWKDIETSPGVWNWDAFDVYIKDRVSDSLPIILMIFTKGNAPDWLYDLGVPKVIERDSKGNQIAYCPSFADPTYKYYFERMITTVRQHIESMPIEVRSWIKGIQGCFGEEGDYIGYKGKVDKQYNLSPGELSDLFKEFSLYYYNEYKNSNPKIYLVSNPSNNGKEQTTWLLNNCPNGWMKYTHLGKVYQLNGEVDKATWLLDVLNKKQNGEYIRSRSELSTANLGEGWWKIHTPRNMFALMCYMVYWGMDWSNQLPPSIENPLYTNAFDFFNRYGGYKDTAKSINAMCALRDGLDASDVKRFPESVFGTADITNTTRFQKIASQFATYGARLDDVAAATGTEADNLEAKGINDVGWRVFPGNYERYLHQIDADSTSTGYWNVDAPADPNSVYGRFARAISKAHGKDALYFNVDNAFFKNAPVDGNYPVAIDITYLDKGTGSFSVYYDSKNDPNQLALQVTCTNTGTWKKASITLNDAYMNNRGVRNSDFYIKCTTYKKVIFSVVEVSKPVQKVMGVAGSAFTATSPDPFDTICYTAKTSAHSFMVNGNFLNGSNAVVGPVAGFLFAENPDSTYKDSITISNYGSSFHKTIYVIFAPKSGGNFNTIPVRGGGANEFDVPVIATALNTSPTLSADITNITCNNTKGAITLNVSGGDGPFDYQWSCSARVFKVTTKDIDSLIPADYTVVVNSKVGCSTSATYTLVQGKLLNAVVIEDSSIVCKGGKTTVTVTAVGGVEPYRGTGSFEAIPGHSNYMVTDKNGCTSTTGITVENGTLVPPAKPTSITGAAADAHGICGSDNFNYQVGAVATATSYKWSLPSNSSFSFVQNDGASINLNADSKFTDGQIAVSAANACGVSTAFVKKVSSLPQKPAYLDGKATVTSQQKNLVYTVIGVKGLTYYWTVPNGAVITAGQNTSAITVNWGTVAGKVQVIARNDCGASDPFTLDVAVSSSSARSSSGNDYAAAMANTKITQLQLLPNPTSNFAYITFADEDHYSVQLFDIAGKALMQKNNCSGSERIDIHNYANGIYLVHVVNSKGLQKTLRLVKQ